MLFSVAEASSDLVRFAQGEFVCAESDEKLKERKDQALRKTLDASNFLVRTIAESKLEGKPDVCDGYQISTTADTMTVTCDSKPTIDIKLDGTATVYPTKDSNTIEVIADVEGTIITQDFQGETGRMRVIYKFSEGQLWVTKIISSEYLGVPLRIDIPYRQRIP